MNRNNFYIAFQSAAAIVLNIRTKTFSSDCLREQHIFHIEYKTDEYILKIIRSKLKTGSEI